jgi:hypothetical protein
LYTLYRRQRLLVPDNSLVATQPAANASQFYEVSYWTNGGNLYFNSPIDITVPQRRVLGIQGYQIAGYSPLPAASGTLYGSDIQLTNMVSFDVRMLSTSISSAAISEPFVTLYQPPFTTYTYTPPSWYVKGRAFDTWSSVNDGLGPNYSTWNTPGQPGVTIPFWNSNTQKGPIIQAIQITIRIWDQKTNQTREVTIVQAM